MYRKATSSSPTSDLGLNPSNINGNGNGQVKKREDEESPQAQYGGGDVTGGANGEWDPESRCPNFQCLCPRIQLIHPHP